VQCGPEVYTEGGSFAARGDFPLDKIQYLKRRLSRPIKLAAGGRRYFARSSASRTIPGVITSGRTMGVPLLPGGKMT
jgi:hypothetical protein